MVSRSRLLTLPAVSTAQANNDDGCWSCMQTCTSIQLSVVFEDALLIETDLLIIPFWIGT